jgi:Xaa-Pro aminopeptidase
VGIEASFLPVEAMTVLEKTQDIEMADAQYTLERLRACKSPAELAIMEQASDLIVESMQEVFTSHLAGTTRRELVEALRREQTNRGLTFEYCLASSGPSHNRAPADIPWKYGQVLCLDSGGNLGGYIGDLARMAVMGEPDSELEDLLAEIEAIQQAARQPIRAGATGQSIFDAALGVHAGSPNRNVTTFVAHGMGLISHEAPRLTATGPVPYPNEDGPQPLQAGMVLSIETTMLHPNKGFIKLEDTVAVTGTGHKAFGDHARGWTRGGQL